MVVHRSMRSDVTFAFLATMAALLLARAAWLQQPWSTPVHQLTNGTLMLFAFHMISDPRTTPDSRAGRILFGALVAALALSIQFLLWRRNGLIWALAAAAPLVPLLDRLLPAARFQWNAPAARPDPTKEDSRHETLAPRPVPARGAVA
jgi:Na+-translocating ferredoxin:NAD+ oxidoreductase RnfD subunit